MLKMDAYLNFNGKTEEAFNFYKSIFGGEFKMIQRFKEIPSSERPMPANEAERIMHVALPIGNDTLMGSDISEGMGMKLNEGNNVYLMLTPDSKEETERLYKSLSAGGKIEMELQKMFWGSYYAAFKDKFGIMWMINFQESK